MIGEFTDDGKLTVCYENDVVGVLDMDFLHDGMPRIHRKAVWRGHPVELEASAPHPDALRARFGPGRS